ncbi:MAG: MAPEG family protein [Gammaproteobacteria bacterium]|jgi:uncharacterized membrane protein YecN with MAPEG domain|nr:MAPEG family protein [Gammaproteobacteria bacterium]
MEATIIVTILALMQFTLFGLQVGSMRAKHQVKAPATTGHDDFERMNRVHLNTLEQLVVFLPALWMHAQVANPLWGALIGLVFIAGRFIYRAEYMKDPSSRSPGFSISFIPSAVLLIWTLVVVVLGMI